MGRREFLSHAIGAGLILAGGNNATAEPWPEDKAIAEGGPLRPPENGPIPVAIAISKGTTWIDFVGPQAVFETWHFDPVEKKHEPRFKMFLVSERVEPVDNLVPDYSFANAPAAKIVIVPAQNGSPGLLDWLRKASQATDITMSVCTGARHLAKAGLLNGHQATSHHGAIDRLSRDYPAVTWVRGVRFVEGPRISTGGGLTAGIDLALRVVERYFGREEALSVADHLEYRSKGWMVGA